MSYALTQASPVAVAASCGAPAAANAVSYGSYGVSTSPASFAAYNPAYGASFTPGLASGAAVAPASFAAYTPTYGATFSPAASAAPNQAMHLRQMQQPQAVLQQQPIVAQPALQPVFQQPSLVQPPVLQAVQPVAAQPLLQQPLLQQPLLQQPLLQQPLLQQPLGVQTMLPTAVPQQVFTAAYTSSASAQPGQRAPAAQLAMGPQSNGNGNPEEDGSGEGGGAENGAPAEMQPMFFLIGNRAPLTYLGANADNVLSAVPAKLNSTNGANVKLLLQQQQSEQATGFLALLSNPSKALYVDESGVGRFVSSSEHEPSLVRLVPHSDTPNVVSLQVDNKVLTPHMKFVPNGKPVELYAGTCNEQGESCDCCVQAQMLEQWSSTRRRCVLL